MSVKPSPLTPFHAMQMAVDAVATSAHPSNKIAACIYKDTTAFAHANGWPSAIAAHFSPETRIGNSSGTVHAEVNCILKAPFATDGASLCITDPFCPNCAKNIAEAGIKHIYIDHKGFAKDFAQRRGEEFENMSLRIAERAGINVTIINRKEETLTPIITIPQDYVPSEDNPVKIKKFVDEKLNFELLQKVIAKVEPRHERWGVALSPTEDGGAVALIASCHPAIGYSQQDNAPLAPEGKYNFWLEPLNRLLMGLKRFGITTPPTYLFTSQIPTSRELVNAVAADIHEIYCANPHASRDADSLDAVNLLSSASILAVKSFKS
jgi:deoxycytidylate deaminase